MGARSSQSRSPNLNSTDGHLVEYFRNIFGAGGGAEPPPPPPGITASGGTTYVPGNGYKYHRFAEPNSDNFVISALSDLSPKNKIDILLVAGGAGSATPSPYTGGGGAGGVAHSVNVTAVTGTYPISVGAGGVSRTNGADSTFAGHPIGTITVKGGGYGGYFPGNPAQPGGSGGGKQDAPDSSGTGTQPAQNPAWTPQPGFNQYGNPGGGGGTTGAYQAPGGGGAGEVGGSAPSSQGGNQPGGYGGRGQPIPGFEYPLIGLGPIDVPQQGNSPTSNHYGGGGMGWGYVINPDASRMRAFGGGGTNNVGDAVNPDVHGPQAGTDGLGGGAGASGGGKGGDGVVVIRYVT